MRPEFNRSSNEGRLHLYGKDKAHFAIEYGYYFYVIQYKGEWLTADPAEDTDGKWRWEFYIDPDTQETIKGYSDTREEAETIMLNKYKQLCKVLVEAL